MNEKENNTTPEENLDYSFDFAGKTEEETPAPEAIPEVPEQPTVDVSVPVLEEATEPEVQETPVPEVQEAPVPEAQPTVDVSVPVMDENAQPEAPVQTEVAQAAPEEELKDSKSTTRFVIIIAIIIVAAIVALPFVFKYIG